MAMQFQESVDAGADVADDGIADSHAVRTGASGGHTVALAPDAMEAVTDSAIPCDVVTKVVDAVRVVSGASCVAAADERRGEGAGAACVASPSTPGASSEAATDGRLGVTVAHDATRVVSGAKGVAAADVRRGGGVAAACVASPRLLVPMVRPSAMGVLVLSLQVMAVSHPSMTLRALRSWLSGVL